MKISLTPTAVLAVVGVAAGAFVLWKAKGAAQAGLNVAGDLVHAMNPLNPDNIFYSGVNDVGASIVTDPDGMGKNADGSWSLGGWWYDVLHEDAGKAVTAIPTPPYVPPQDAAYDPMTGLPIGGW